MLPLKNSKTSWILVRPLWLFSQTPCIHLGIPRGGGGGGGGGGGSKLIIFQIANFFHSKILHALIQRGGGGGQGARTPPGKTQVIWASIGNKQLDPPPPGKNVGAPLEPRKIIIFVEINHWHSVK